MKMYNPNDEQTANTSDVPGVTSIPTAVSWETNPANKLDLLLTYMFRPTVNPIWTDAPSLGQILAENSDPVGFAAATKEALVRVVEPEFTGEVIVEVTSSVAQDQSDKTIDRVGVFIQATDKLGVITTRAMLEIKDGKLLKLIEE